MAPSCPAARADAGRDHLPGHLGGVRSAAISARWVATGGSDGAIVLRRRSGRIAATFQVLPGGWITHTPRGAWMGEGAEPWTDRPSRPDRVSDALRRS